MKIKLNNLRFAKKPFMVACIFACLIVFASFSKEDIRKVREFKLRMMEKYIHYKKDEVISTEDSKTKKFQNYKEPAKNSITDNFKEATVTSSKLTEKIIDNIFESEEKQGMIGEFSEDESDNPSDNFFTINIPEIKEQDIKAYLIYDLFGLDSYHSVSRSINKNIAFGGNIIVPNGKWSPQKEEISPNSLNTGKNTILFTTSVNGIKYKVKNVKILFEKNLNPSVNISTLLSGNQLYIKGLESGTTNNIHVNNKYISTINGEYETLLELTDADKTNGFITITNSNGVREYRLPANTTSFKTLKEERFEPHIINIFSDTEKTEEFEGSMISIEKNSVAETAQLQILKLRKKDYPAVSSEIKNLIIGSAAYRVDIKSGELSKKVKFSFPYDDKNLGARSAKEIKAFYFDYKTKKWKVDPTSVVDTEKKVVTVETNGDTDYINGVISVPESSQLEAFTPTSISGLKAADPTAGLQLMEVPTATQKGDVNANYPIRVPSGIGGVQPSLSIGYNSGGGNGWMGDGWNINGVSSITVDTRWGVPTFDGNNDGTESEVYSLDGEMLVYPNGYLPHRHNDVSETDTSITTAKQLKSSYTTNDVKKFYLRKNHDFTLIERVGASTSNYYWKVTSTNGTVSVYGGSPDSVIQGDGGIVHWALRLVQDVHGNKMEFNYYNESVLQGQASVSGGKFFQIKKISYGKNKDYTVNFNKETTITRKDISINAKQGLKRVEPYLLKSIEVKYKTELVRTYKLEYINGEFFKTLLKKIYIVPHNPCSTTIASREEGGDIDDGGGGGGGGTGGIDESSCNEITDSYTFEYYNDVRDSQGNLRLFGPDTFINFQNDQEAYSKLIKELINPSKINGNISSEKGLNMRFAAGLNFFYASSDAYGHLMFGFPFGYSKAEARNAQQLTDFNGDGIQDMIYRVPDLGLYLRTGKLDNNGTLSFTKSQKIANYSGEFSFTETKTNTHGSDIGLIIINNSKTSSSSKSTTTSYLIDANSDGLLDIVNNGEVWFNRFDTTTGKSEMTKHSEYTENMVVKKKDIQAPVKYCGDIGSDMTEPCPEDMPEPVPVTDVVKVWIAPMDGYIRFTDNIMMSNYGAVQNPPQKIYYSVEMQSPFPVGSSGNVVNGRIYLTQLIAGNPAQNIVINKYNDYYSQIVSLPQEPNYGHGAINSADRLYVKSGEKVFIRLHKNKDQNFPVISNPKIDYVDSNGNLIGNTAELSQSRFYVNNGSYGNNFFLNNISGPLYLDTQASPASATINVPSILLQNLSDKVTFRIVKENAINGATDVVLPAEIYSPQNSQTTAHTLNVDVYPGEPVYLRFIVESDSQTDFIAENWNGKISVDYNGKIIDNGQTIDVNVNYLPVPEYPSFVVTNLEQKFDMRNTSNNAGLNEFSNYNFGVQINKNIANSSNLGVGRFYYIVKRGNEVLGKRSILVGYDSNSNFYIEETDMVSGQNVSGISAIDFFTGSIAALPYITSDISITIQVYCKTEGDYTLFKKYSEYFMGKPFNIYYDNTGVYTDTTATAVNTAMYNSSSLFYNNWGQFLYKPGSFVDYMYGPTMSPGIFSTNTTVAPQNTFPLCQHLTDPSDLANCIYNNYGTAANPNVGSNVVSLMKPLILKEQDRSLWIGVGPDQYASESDFSNDETLNFFGNPVAGLPVTTPTTYTSGQLTLDSTMKAINRNQKSSSDNTTNATSASIGSGGANLANSITTGYGIAETQTFSDMNGDGYPDLVYPQSIQFTNSAGSLSDIQLVPYGEPTLSSSYQKMNSVGFNYNSPPVTGRIGAMGQNGTSTQADTGMPWAGGASISASYYNYYDSYDKGNEFWVDINGDGLPDRIRDVGVTTNYALNLGKSISGFTAYENLIPYRSHPKAGATVGVGIGAGLSSSVDYASLGGFGFGISASVGASTSIGTADVVYEDVNGDGLVDILEIDNKNNLTKVRYNLGSRFENAVPLLKSSGEINFTDETRSYNGSFSFGGSYMFNYGPILLIPPVVVLWIFAKAGLGATANLGLNVTETRKAFKDMNGDGFTDVVQDTKNGFTVNYSLVGRTNKLKSITNTISKGKYLVDYQFARANYQNPHAKLVVKKVSIVEPDVYSQNYTKEQGAKIETQYSFEGRKYDRREREDFGFSTVIKKELNVGNVVRTYTDYYLNSSYFTNGLILHSLVQDGGGNSISKVSYYRKLHKFKNNNSEIDLDSNLPSDYDSGGTEGRKMATNLLAYKMKVNFDGAGAIVTREQFSYTEKGLIKKYQYISPSTSYNTNITYQAFNNNIIGVPVIVKVFAGTGSSTLLRQRSAENINPNTGDIRRFVVYDGNQNITTDVEYNTAGNVKKITYPPNSNGQRYSLEYTYDDTITGKYVTKVKDIFNIESSATYSPLFDVVTRKVDAGGNAMVFYYDGFGRVKSIMGPNEIASGSTVPTVKYRYWTDHAGIPNTDASVKLYRASTSNYDPEYAADNNTIMTDTYADFLGRIIQVKKDIEMNGAEVRSVSGRMIFDQLGRVLRQYHPTYDMVGNQNLKTNNTTVPSTYSSYDSRDRMVSATNEDGNTKTTAYTIENNMLKVTEQFVDQKSESYSNAEGKIVQKNDYLYNNPLTTTFEYNTIGELVMVTDPENITTEYSYDLAGRRTSQLHRDKGSTIYEYDPAGNLVKLITDNLANDPSISTNFIQYKYDHNRLSEIVLPDLPSGDPNPDNVLYQYGPSGAGNNAGKLVTKETGSGVHSYKYGRMGEVISETRTVRGYYIPNMYFKTQFNYDSWNRITKIKYPDDEIVDYHYDRGGNLKSVTNDSGETYIEDIAYDQYEQRVSVHNGNGTYQQYLYYPENRRLQNSSLFEPSGNAMLYNTYKFDEYANITTIKNEAYPLGNGMGGAFQFEFNYDTLNRLIGTGSSETILDGENQPILNTNLAPSSYRLEMEYNNAGGIISKKQYHERDQQVVAENTYENYYSYIPETHKLADVLDPASGIYEAFEYDYNGNVTHDVDDYGVKQMYWDEQDRLKAFYDDSKGVYQYYTYDDKAERVVKYGLEVPSQLYQNGAPVYTNDLKLFEYKLYPNPYITVSSTGQYTKHYFDGTKRFASRLMDDANRFEDPSVLWTSRSAQNKAPEKAADTESDFKKYLEKTGLGDEVSVELREVYQRTNLYYLHGDHLGTATFVTNSQGETTQFFLNLPFGETMLEQMDGTYNNPYKFNAKELDEDTGLYYYGARYYNPRLSIWYGVDPLAIWNPVMETEFYGDGQHNGGVYFWGNLNPYIYCYQSPIVYFDPNGKQSKSEIIQTSTAGSIALQGSRGITVLGTGGGATGFLGGLFGGFLIGGGMIGVYKSYQAQQEYLQNRAHQFNSLSREEQNALIVRENIPITKQDDPIKRDFPAAIQQKITILSADYSNNDKKKVNSAEVGDIVQTPDSNPANFVKKGKNYTNSKTKEIWQKSNTQHSGEKEWKVGIGRNEPTSSKKITVTASDRKILKKDL